MQKNELKKLPLAVQDYLHYISAIKNKSQLTVLEYASDLRTFFRYVSLLHGLADEATPFEEIDLSPIDLSLIKNLRLNDAYGFLSYCRDVRGNDTAARARKATAIKLFFHYLAAEKLLDENPMQHLELPKLKKTLPKYLTLEESRNLLNHVDGTHKERDYCILTLFLNCGLRLAELVALNLSDVRDDGSMRVTGKGNKERTIYLNAACVQALDAYLAVRPHDGVKDRDAIFLSARRQRISPKTVQYIVKTFLDKSGLSGKGLSTHKLRHTAATLLYQHGQVDVLLIKEMLGHENLSTTQIYTHVASEQLRQAAQANPLADLTQVKTTASKDKKADKSAVENGVQHGGEDAQEE